MECCVSEDEREESHARLLEERDHLVGLYRDLKQRVHELVFSERHALIYPGEDFVANASE